MPDTIKFFEAQLNREILESESLRVKILAGVAAVPVVLLTILTLFLSDRILKVAGSLDPLYLIILVLLVFSIREFNISLIINPRFRSINSSSDCGKYLPAWFLQASAVTKSNPSQHLF